MPMIIPLRTTFLKETDNVDKGSTDSHCSRKRRKIGASNNGGYVHERFLKGTGGSVERSPANSSEIKMPRHSPSEVCSGRSSVEGPPSRSFVSSHVRVDNTHQPVCSRISAPNAHDRVSYSGSLAGIRGGLSRSYSMSNTEPYSNEINGLSVGANVDGYKREYRSDAANIGYRTYRTELDRETEIQSQSHLVGQAFDSFGQSSYSAGPDAGYGWMESQYSTPDGSSYRMSRSAMQRYAPQLDELNYTRMNSGFASEAPFMGGSGTYVTRPPQPGFQADSMNFAPAPHHPYSPP